MRDIKILALSKPVTFELEPTDFAPDSITVRLEPGSAFVAGFKAVDASGGHVKDAIVDYILDAIREWDLTVDGEPLPCTAEVKERYRTTFKRLLDVPLRGKPDAILGTALFTFVGNRENFLGN